jgi:16S rRNA (cytosine1402-N4)-methyltransferase
MAKEQEYDYHNPVLLKECLDFLIVNKNGLYIDGTLGGGGHTAAILGELESGGRLISFDKDPDAIEHCQKRFSTQIENGVLQLRNASFDEACSIRENDGKVSGLLLDLGVSSYQLDGSNRGISYRYDSELDMRFGTEGETAKDFLHTASEEELIQVFMEYGEDPYSKKIARRIVEVRRASSLRTTKELTLIIAEIVPERFLYKTLSRIFQAIRIRVNSELTTLENALNGVIPMLEVGGRAVIISYHSLEDRIVKDVFRKFAMKKRPSVSEEELIYGNFVEVAPTVKLLTKSPIIPSKQEIELNKRARSAKLRVAEKL